MTMRASASRHSFSLLENCVRFCFGQHEIADRILDLAILKCARKIFRKPLQSILH